MQKSEVERASRVARKLVATLGTRPTSSVSEVVYLLARYSLYQEKRLRMLRGYLFGATVVWLLFGISVLLYVW